MSESQATATAMSPLSGVDLAATKAPKAKPTIKKYNASVFSSAAVLPIDFTSAVLELESSLDMSLWMLIQNGPAKRYDSVDEQIIEVFLDGKHAPPDSRLTL